MKRLVLFVLFISIVISLFLWQKQMVNKENTDASSISQDQREELAEDGQVIENSVLETDTENEDSTADPEKKGHWETVSVYEPAWDEYILIQEGWTETVLVKDAWDEEETYCSIYGQDSYNGYECNCRKVSGTLEEVMKHVEEDENCNSWHSKTIYYGEPHCLSYQTDFIHHDAQYQDIYHDPEYKIVHHESRTYEKQVWVEE